MILSKRFFGGLRWLAVLSAGLVGLTVVALDSGLASGQTVRAHAAYVPPPCTGTYSNTRDPANPLALPRTPGGDPLTGANFFIDGPRHGAAAGAIAQLLGSDPTSYTDEVSWAQFQQQLSQSPFADKLAASPSLAYKVRMLEKIAIEPEAQRFSIYSQGGGPGAIYNQVRKLLCGNLRADPSSIPIISTYFLHPAVGGCPTSSQLNAAGPEFRRRVDEMTSATENRPAVYLLELDAIGSSRCIKGGALRLWEGDLRYEALQLQALPHTLVYLEAGYSDGNPPGYTAKLLNASGVRQIRGFFTNDTHLNWTINEVNWAEKVSKLTGGAHYIVNTAQNGQGPKLNPHPVTQGTEDICNPPGRGLGPRPTTKTGFPHADAFLWTHVPGNSGGSCNGGTPSGTFWPAGAIGLASRANERLGPGYPSQPY